MSSCSSCGPASSAAAPPPERSAPPPPPAPAQAQDAPKVQAAKAPGTGEVVDINA